MSTPSISLRRWPLQYHLLLSFPQIQETSFASPLWPQDPLASLSSAQQVLSGPLDTARLLLRPTSQDISTSYQVSLEIAILLCV